MLIDEPTSVGVRHVLPRIPQLKIARPVVVLHPIFVVYLDAEQYFAIEVVPYDAMGARVDTDAINLRPDLAILTSRPVCPAPPAWIDADPSMLKALANLQSPDPAMLVNLEHALSDQRDDAALG